MKEEQMDPNSKFKNFDFLFKDSRVLAFGSQLMGKASTSPGGTAASSFDNTTTSQMPYVNSPRSAANMMNIPSPQQKTQQQRQKFMKLPNHQQQMIAHQLRQSPMTGLGQAWWL
ncbi:hypothetical protein E3N88_38830 [Mikania micrantha]|uniref:Uncharacterized protein n=1 Tax=Mikania micrantha TaxID=192012 RepID=A0A5N6LV29_9ASTR|nr:hypothetical protein E3N88_38830 [Mikania micrantha]